MNVFDQFTVLFSDENALLGGEAVFPLGQISTDFLNLDEEVITQIEQRVLPFVEEARTMLRNKNSDAAFSVQEKLNAALDLIFSLPFYRDLPLDLYTSAHAFLMLREYEEQWNVAVTEDTFEHKSIMEFIDRVEYFPKSLRNFRGQIRLMLEVYFEKLPHRNSTAYAEAYVRYFQETAMGGALFYPDKDFEQAFDVTIKFVPLFDSVEKKMVLGEKTEFSYLSHFLYTDFYRALIAGNIPRCCHNCGTYFLLTRGYDTCYCNNIAPGETEKTCRKVGAHKKAERTEGKTPAQVEYRKVYNRLKTRKARGKISVDEWNAAVALAQDYKDKAESGEISDAQLKAIFKEI